MGTRAIRSVFTFVGEQIHSFGVPYITGLQSRTNAYGEGAGRLAVFPKPCVHPAGSYAKSPFRVNVERIQYSVLQVKNVNTTRQSEPVSIL